MSMSKSSANIAQAILLILGLSIMVTGAYFPVIVRAVNTYVAQSTITVTGGGSASSITLAIASVDYVQCASCGNLYQEVQFGNTFQLGGQINSNTANLPISLQVTVSGTQYSASNLYVTDSQGKYGWATNSGTGDGNLMQLKSDGIYAKGSRLIAISLSVGSTVAFKTQVSSVLSSEGDMKIVGSGIAPSGMVKLVGGNGQVFTIDSSSNVQTTSPLAFTVTITQGGDNVQSMNLYYWTYGSMGTQQTSPLTSCGTNMYCGTLTLQPGTYVVKVNITPKQGQPIVLLSILGYFDIPSPQPAADLSYYIGIGIMIVGAIITIGTAYMPVGRRMP